MLPDSWKRDIEESIEKAQRRSDEGHKSSDTEKGAAIVAALTAIKHHFEREAEKERRPKKIKIWTDAITLLLVAFTALFTGLAWWVFRGQLREMEKVFEPISQQAQSIKDQIALA